MNPEEATSAQASHAFAPRAALVAVAAVLICAYSALAALSFRFAPGSEPTERPILAGLALLTFSFLCYVVAIRVALRVRQGRWLLSAILIASVLMRVVSLFSWPILEIDIYRYIWDGAVTLDGTSPYRYSPEQVLSATPHAGMPNDLDRLASLRDETPAVKTILSRVHYAELPTIYPPVSQAVFALAVFITPSSASVFTHVVVMKAVLLLFDLATVVVVIGLLRLAGRHVGWSVAYAWCPLVVKEFANSGHSDSVAVFLTALALYFALKPLADGAFRRGGGLQAVGAAVLLALAVGAKLYPIVLVPLFVLLWRQTHGWRWTATAATAFLVTATLVLWPMLPERTAPAPPVTVEATADRNVPTVPTDTAQPQHAGSGLETFLRRWEMNDFLFLAVVENLRPAAGVEPGHRAWFAVVPERTKAALVSPAARWLGVDESQAAFALARLLTTALFVLIFASLLWQTGSSRDPAAWLRAAFLTLAWFWLLSPTQNPWYWTWALPLVAFARSRAWLAISGLVLVYYLRFWLIYHWPDAPLLGTPYAGAAFFDFVIPWLEFAPWLVWLGWETIHRRPQR